MVPFMMLSASCDDKANGVTFPKTHVVPHFKFLDPRNSLVPFMLPSVSCVPDANVNSVTSPKGS